MLKKLSLATVAVASICAMPAAAASVSGEFAAKGPGRAPCSEFMDAKSSDRPEYRQYLAFFEGFLSAANRYEPETFDLAPWHNAAAIGMIVEQYCKANTADSLAVVGTRLAEAFKPIRLASPSPLVEVGEGANRAVLYEQNSQAGSDRAQGQGAISRAYRRKVQSGDKNRAAGFPELRGSSIPPECPIR